MKKIEKNVYTANAEPFSGSAFIIGIYDFRKVLPWKGNAYLYPEEAQQ